MERDFDLSGYTEYGGELRPHKIISKAREKGESLAYSHYPYAVYRDRAGLQRIAEQECQKWSDKLVSLSEHDSNLYRGRKIWQEQISEVKRLFVSGFIAGYEETIAKKDEEARPKVQPQSKTQPEATPTNTATLQGATIVLKRVDRKTNEYVYSLELSDPEYFDGVEKTEWVVYFEGASVPATEAATTTAAYGMASMSDVGYAYGSATPQKAAKKPKGSYLRKPQ